MALRAAGQPARYFGPLLAAYGGMRISEIAQLRVRDLTEFDGFWTIDVQLLADASPESGDQHHGRHHKVEDENRVKSPAAYRRIPVHPVLVRVPERKSLTGAAG